MFGARGLSQTYPLDGSALRQATDAVLCMSVDDKQPNLEDMITIINWVLSSLVCSGWDSDYVSILVRHVMTHVVDSSVDTMPLGSVEIPVAPAAIEPSEFASLIEEKMDPELSSLEALSLHAHVDREVNDALASEFMACLDRLYEAQNMDVGDLSLARFRPVDVLRLRAILDTVLEKLPCLLELGDMPEIGAADGGRFDFPYHRPSILSLATTESIILPESVGFVLLQECVWLNTLLCHIRQNVYDVHTSLLGGPEAFPWQLQGVVSALREEQVPVAWVHPNCQPSTHSLLSWQDDMKRRHKQMAGWVKHRMVPIYDDGPPESHGRLRSVWLGGLVNPTAIFMAIRQEKAVMAGTTVDQIELTCDVCTAMGSEDREDHEDDENEDEGIYLRDLTLQGASWDVDKSMLAPPTQDLSAMPYAYVRTVVKAQNQETSEDKPITDEDQGTSSEFDKYHCPLFMNKARQVCSIHLPLNCTKGEVEKWQMAGTAVILDPGIPEDSSKKSRSMVASKAAIQTLTARSDDSLEDQPEHYSPEEFEESFEEEEKEETVPPEEEEEETVQPEVEEEHKEEPEEIKETDRSDDTHASYPLSQQSQLSYRPLTPKASPLPPELKMKREPPMLKDESRETMGSRKSDKQKTSDKGSKKKDSSRSSKDSLGTKKSESKASKTSKASKKGDERYASKDTVASKDSKKSDSKDSVASKKSEDRHTSKDSVAKKSDDSKGSKKSESRESLASKKSKRSDDRYASKDSVASRKSVDSKASDKGAAKGTKKKKSPSPEPQRKKTPSPEHKKTPSPEPEEVASPKQEEEEQKARASSPVESHEESIHEETDEDRKSPVNQRTKSPPQDNNDVEEEIDSGQGGNSPQQQRKATPSPAPSPQPAKEKSPTPPRSSPSPPTKERSPTPSPRKESLPPRQKSPTPEPTESHEAEKQSPSPEAQTEEQKPEKEPSPAPSPRDKERQISQSSTESQKVADKGGSEEKQE